MADFEDANTPTWRNMVQGQVNLVDAIARHDRAPEPGRTGLSPERRRSRPCSSDRAAGTSSERHFLVDGAPVSGSLFDFGLYIFHNGRRLLERGSGPYFYLPKLESHLEARLWNDAFVLAEDRLGLPRGAIRATVLVETIPAAFEMDEILWELRDHSGGLNAGRWDYMFSLIKKFRARPEFVLPDRAQVTMTVPFMRAYTELLVKTCHRRGAHALGGMAAFIPNRRDPQVNEVALARVREDKVRESADGFDGTWVAHPDLVAVAREPFAAASRGPPAPARAAAPRGGGRRAGAARRPGPRRDRDRGGSPDQRERRAPVPGGVARRERRRRHQQPHGGRRDRRDLALPGLAVGPPRGPPRRRSRGDARARAPDPGRGGRQDPRRRSGRPRTRAATTTRRATSSRRWRSASPSSSS